MNTKQRFSLIVLVGTLVISAGLLAVATLPVDASHWLGRAPAGLAPPAQISPGLLQGLYLGRVELDWAAPGEFGDDLTAPPAPPDLGDIDLALQLSHDGSTISGYVDLEFTLVFTTEHVVDDTAYGPSVTGSFDGPNLTLTSERVSLSSAGRSLMRQFRLTGQMESEEDNLLSGEYRETVWGYGPQPLTIVGTFTLVGPQLVPEAEFVAGPTTGPARLEVSFSDLSSNEPTSWSWDFGDNQTSTEQDPTHTYDQPGDYTVSLTVSNAYGSDTRTEVDYISVSDPVQPVANFYASPLTGTVPLTVTFSDVSAGSPESWLWNFGDGGTSSEQDPSHTYDATGSYTVTLTVSNTLGMDTLTRTNYITVTAGPPVANFSASPIFGTPPLTVTFTDESTGEPTSWAWDFGDGGSSTEQHPSHTYVETGAFTVTLTVSNTAGSDTMVDPACVNVTAAGEQPIYLPLIFKDSK